MATTVQTSTTAPTARQQEQQGSGNPNLQQILNQNVGYASAMGSGIANNLNQQGNQFQTQTNTAANNYQGILNNIQNTAENTLGQGSQILNGGTTDPSQYQSKNPNANVTNYNALQGGQSDPNYYANIGNAINQVNTSGPSTNFGDTSAGKAIGNQIQNIQGEQANSRTAGGQQQLLNSIGRGGYTPGESALDQALLSQNGGAQKQILQASNNLGQTAQNAQQLIGTENTNASNLSTQLGNEKDNLLGNISTAAGNLNQTGLNQGAGFKANVNDLGTMLAGYDPSTGGFDINNPNYASIVNSNTPGTLANGQPAYAAPTNASLSSTLQAIINAAPGNIGNTGIYQNDYNSNNRTNLGNIVNQLGANLNANQKNGVYYFNSPEQQTALSNLLAFANGATPGSMSGAIGTLGGSNAVINPANYLNTIGANNTFINALGTNAGEQTADLNSINAYKTYLGSATGGPSYTNGQSYGTGLTGQQQYYNNPVYLGTGTNGFADNAPYYATNNNIYNQSLNTNTALTGNTGWMGSTGQQSFVNAVNNQPTFGEGYLTETPSSPGAALNTYMNSAQNYTNAYNADIANQSNLNQFLNNLFTTGGQINQYAPGQSGPNT